MTITLTPEIEQILAEEAQKTGTTPEELAMERLRASINSSKLGDGVTLSFVDYREMLPPPRDEWELRLRSASSPCGVSLSNESISSEGIYE